MASGYQEHFWRLLGCDVKIVWIALWEKTRGGFGKGLRPLPNPPRVVQTLRSRLLLRYERCELLLRRDCDGRVGRVAVRAAAAVVAAAHAKDVGANIRDQRDAGARHFGARLDSGEAAAGAPLHLVACRAAHRAPA